MVQALARALRVGGMDRVAGSPPSRPQALVLSLIVGAVDRVFGIFPAGTKALDLTLRFGAVDRVVRCIPARTKALDGTLRNEGSGELDCCGWWEFSEGWCEERGKKGGRYLPGGQLWP